MALAVASIILAIASFISSGTQIYYARKADTRAELLLKATGQKQPEIAKKRQTPEIRSASPSQGKLPSSHQSILEKVSLESPK